MSRRLTPLTDKQCEEITFRLRNGESPIKVAREYKTNANRVKQIAGIDEKLINKVSTGERVDEIMLRTRELKSKWVDFQVGKLVKVKEINCGKVYHYSGEIIYKNNNHLVIVRDSDGRKLSISFGDFCTNFYVEVI